MISSAGNGSAERELTVIGGAGHVGIPLALCFSDRGFRVVINDRNRRALDTLNRGRLPFIEQNAQPLL